MAAFETMEAGALEYGAAQILELEAAKTRLTTTRDTLAACVLTRLEEFVGQLDPNSVEELQEIKIVATRAKELVDLIANIEDKAGLPTRWVLIDPISGKKIFQAMGAVTIGKSRMVLEASTDEVLPVPSIGKVANTLRRNKYTSGIWSILLRFSIDPPEVFTTPQVIGLALDEGILQAKTTETMVYYELAKLVRDEMVRRPEGRARPIHYTRINPKAWGVAIRALQQRQPEEIPDEQEQ